MVKDKKDDFIFGPYDSHADEEEKLIKLPQIYIDDKGQEHKMPHGHYRCECCGDYFSADEGRWIGENFFCNKDKKALEELDRDEMKTRTGEIPTFPGDKP